MRANANTRAQGEERRNREAALDRTIEESFPASDPLSSIPNPDAPGGEDARPASSHYSAGDAVTSDCRVIEVHVAELNQMFNAIDPTPFRQRDLDPAAEEFIVGWARELPPTARIALVVRLDRTIGRPEEPAVLREAIGEFFAERAHAARRRLRELFRRGRVSLAIGVCFLALAMLLGDTLARLLGERRVAELLRESLIIGGWVAMWRPMEVFLYDWWPILAEARLADRLSAMPVRIVYEADADADAWRSDWPAAATSMKPAAVPVRR